MELLIMYRKDKRLNAGLICGMRESAKFFTSKVYTNLSKASQLLRYNIYKNNKLANYKITKHFQSGWP